VGESSFFIHLGYDKHWAAKKGRDRFGCFSREQNFPLVSVSHALGLQLSLSKNGSKHVVALTSCHLGQGPAGGQPVGGHENQDGVFKSFRSNIKL
jgi:hypothetical protein